MADFSLNGVMIRESVKERNLLICISQTPEVEQGTESVRHKRSNNCDCPTYVELVPNM